MSDDLLFVELVSTVFVYLAFPILFLITKTPVTKSSAHKIALINSIVCCLIFGCIRAATTGAFTISGGPPVLYYFINKRILAKNNVPDKATKEADKVDEENEDVDEEFGEADEENYEELDEEVDNETDYLDEEEHEEHEEIDGKANEYSLEIKRLKNLYLKWENLFKDILNENPSLKGKYEEYEEVCQEQTSELDKKDEVNDVNDN